MLMDVSPHSYLPEASPNYIDSSADSLMTFSIFTNEILWFWWECLCVVPTSIKQVM